MIAEMGDGRERYPYRSLAADAGQAPVAVFIAQVFDVMVAAEQHVFQVLTKRADRLVELAPLLPWPSNVWMGVSIENRRLVHRADLLRQVPAAVRFISAEPLLGPLESLDLTGIHWLIAGGESGPRHRPVRAAWIRTLREQCSEADVPFFFKQWAAEHPRQAPAILTDRPGTACRRAQGWP